MYDIISLRGLSASGTHGVYDFEQTQPQPFIVDVAVWVDISEAAENDNIDQTVSYADVARDVAEIINGPSVHLIETLADRMATRIMEYPLVVGVQVVVHKPQAPMPHEFSDVSVTVRRGHTDVTDQTKIIEEVFPPFTVTYEEAPAEAGRTADEAADNGQGVDRPSTFVATVASAPGVTPTATPLAARMDPRTPRPHAEAMPTPDALAPRELPPSPRSSEAPAAPENTHTGAAHTPPLGRDVTEAAVNDSVPQPVPFVLGFGGNQGNVPLALVKAVGILIDTPEIEIHDVSPLLRTRAVLKPGMDPQDDHWNMVVTGSTTMEPHDLLAITSAVEQALGRKREFQWAPRTIDIDIITMGDVTINDDVLQLPHPRAYGRAFVLLPWLLIDSDAELPGYGKAMDLIAHAPDRDGVVDVIEAWYENPGEVMADSDAVLAAQAQSSSTPATPESRTATPGPHAVPATHSPVQPEGSSSAPFAAHEASHGSVTHDAPASTSAQPAATAPATTTAPAAATQPPSFAPVVNRSRLRPRLGGPSRARHDDATQGAAGQAGPVEEAHQTGAAHLTWKPMRPSPADHDAHDATQHEASATAHASEGTPGRQPVRRDTPASLASEPANTSSQTEGLHIVTWESLTATPSEASHDPASTVDDADDRAYGVPSFDEALEAEHHTREQASVPWIPVNSSSTAPGTASTRRSSRGDVSGQPRPLPNWNFAQARVTIIDSVDEGSLAVPPASATEPAEASTLIAPEELSTVHAITVDPSLPEGTDIGALQADDAGHAPVSRKGILRPTHTGAVPVKRHP